jgi:hypothetical protein
MNTFEDQTAKSIESFLTRLSAFEYALAYAKKIDGCINPDCEVRKRVLAGDTQLIQIWCDICIGKCKLT